MFVGVCLCILGINISIGLFCSWGLARLGVSAMSAHFVNCVAGRFDFGFLFHQLRRLSLFCFCIIQHAVPVWEHRPNMIPFVYTLVHCTNSNIYICVGDTLKNTAFCGEQNGLLYSKPVS